MTLLACGPKPPPATPAAQPPPARVLLERSVQAAGGDALRAASTSYSAGTITFMDLGTEATYETWRTTPDLTLTHMQMEGMGAFQSGFDGTISWTTGELTEPAILPEDELPRTRFGSAFTGDADHESRYPSVQTVGLAEARGTPCWEVRGVSTLGDQYLWCFAQESGLLLRTTHTAKTEVGPVTSTTHILEYTQFDGVQVPTVTEMESVMNMRTVVTAFELDPAGEVDFTPPPEVRALLED